MVRNQIGLRGSSLVDWSQSCMVSIGHVPDSLTMAK
jgi:hypothetical protein